MTGILRTVLQHGPAMEAEARPSRQLGSGACLLSGQAGDQVQTTVDDKCSPTLTNVLQSSASIESGGWRRAVQSNSLQRPVPRMCSDHHGLGPQNLTVLTAAVSWTPRRYKHHRGELDPIAVTMDHPPPNGTMRAASSGSLHPTLSL